MKTAKNVVEEVKSYINSLQPTAGLSIVSGLGFIIEVGWKSSFPSWVYLEYNSDFDNHKLYFELFEGTMSLKRSVYPNIHIHGKLVKDFYKENSK